jgi:pyruvate dehydrogenase E1 component alpha subunit
MPRAFLHWPGGSSGGHHRTHGYFFAKGSPMRALFAELYGRETGANGGKAGSQDISMTSHRMFGGAILAGAISIAIGTAMAAQIQGAPYIAISGFGEAATEEGAFWEALSYSVVRKLPIVFLCENNGYSMYSQQLKRQPGDNVSARVAAFGIQTATIFGNDVVECHRAVGEALDRARRGEGPTFVEAYTYRWNGHVGPEDDDWIGYRPEAEREFWKQNDPIVLLEEQLRGAGLLSDPQRRNAEKEIEDEISDAFAFAKNSAFPQLSDWESLNLAQSTPVADRLLKDLEAADFDHDQPDLVPGPY